jgi:site-specific DNA recombinase
MPRVEAQARKPLRCAIYTRKSTDHNLDLEFNSLDAQREACEAYIKSQAHEGWRLVPDHYDDGAFSGASLERPALQQLLTEVRAGQVDVIVVYKVDRLTRSLADFAKLVELFNQHAVSFVSVTQSFNTTSSMGRLTLNVLLSFAQFEREVIGERVRDKIAASKAKGLWVGGSIPLGYATKNKKLIVIPEEAETVLLIFQRYLDLGSVRDLVEDLDNRGIRTRRQTLSDDKIRGGIRFGVGSLSHLLRNRFYLGEVVYRGKIYVGEHTPIVDRKLFDAVQAKLTANTNVRELRLKSSPSILTGRIFDDRGHRMSPTHTNKKGARYRYYVSHAILQKLNKAAGSIRRVNAADIEALVIKSVRSCMLAEQAEGKLSFSDRELIDQLVEKVVVTPNVIEISLQSLTNPGASVITVPWVPPTAVAAKGILGSPPAKAPSNPRDRDALLSAIAKARCWVEDLCRGRAGSFAEIAKRESRCERHVRLLAPLAFVAPSIVVDILEGHVPAVGVTRFAYRLPFAWSRQRLAAAHNAR